MSFLEFDHALVRACVEGRPYAWEDFVDRFMELAIHVVEHVAERRAVKLDEEEKIEICEAIFRAFRYNRFQLLREFQPTWSSLRDASPSLSSPNQPSLGAR